MKHDYETGMRIVYEAASGRVIVSFRGRITALPGDFDNEKDAILAGEGFCRRSGWCPAADRKAGGKKRLLSAW